jgi:hypothetical protein
MLIFLSTRGGKVQLGLLEQQIRDPSIHIVQRSKLFGEYEAKGGSSRDVLAYFDSAIKPMLEKYYREQNAGEA